MSLAHLPEPVLARGVGDFLELHERCELGQATKALHAAMRAGTAHPLYESFYQALTGYLVLSIDAGTADRKTAAATVARAHEHAQTDRRCREAPAWQANQLRFARALAHRADIACKGVLRDPRSGFKLSECADVAWYLGRTADAERLLVHRLRLSPGDAFARLQLIGVLLQAGRPGEAKAHAAALPRTTPKAARDADTAHARVLLLQAHLANGAPAALDELRAAPPAGDVLVQAMVAHTLGDVAASDAALDRYLRARAALPPDARLAEAHAWRGEIDLAFEHIVRVAERELDSTGLWHVVHSPFVDALRHDPRWGPLLSRMGRAPRQLAAIEFTLPASIP